MTYLIAMMLFPLILLTALLLLEIAIGRRPLKVATITDVPPAEAVIVVPAHDEEVTISATLAALKVEAAGIAQILVVADNCTDRTAALVRALGVELIERTNLTQIGKGFALDFAKAHLRLSPPAAVVIIDADCRIDHASLRALIAAATTNGRPAQAINLLEPAPRASPVVQLSTFAFMIKNLVRQRGLQRMAGHARLTGTGMAFPWTLFDEADLATGSIVEDLKLGIELAARGRGARLIENARVWSPAAPEAVSADQRRRWEGGLLATAREAAPGAFAQAARRLDPGAMVAALDLLIPPLALLIIVDVAALFFASVVTAMTGAAWWPITIHLGLLFAVGLMMGLVWWREGRVFLEVRALAQVPFYALRKLPMYINLGRRGRPGKWVRTDRGSGPEDGTHD